MSLPRYKWTQTPKQVIQTRHFVIYIYYVVCVLQTTFFSRDGKPNNHNLKNRTRQIMAVDILREFMSISQSAEVRLAQSVCLLALQ